MYEYHNNILSIPAKLLYEDWGLMTYKTYLSMCYRKKLIRTKEGRGAGNEAFVSFHDLPIDIKTVCVQKLGNPKEVVVRNQLENYILPDPKAIQFFASHRKPNGKPLAEEDQRERATNAMILNAIQMVFKDKGVMVKMFGKKKTLIWQNISEAVNAINPNKWTYSLPGNARSLQRKYDKYLIEGYKTFIHAGEGLENARVIKGEIADFILAQYCLPTKLSIPMVLWRYNEVAESKGWPEITEQAIHNFLNEPERMRIWTLARHGKEAYDRKYKHTLTRNKSDWFPNSFWAIDGTKLDWIHYWEDSDNKMGAKLKIDVMFDVYSEKVIGWSLSFSESHIDHFKAIKMAVNESQCRPYYLTYDHQSGHQMDRMQELYDSLVAVEGGTHFANKVKSHNNPAEQLFNRLQQQVINKFWFSDGQSIKVRRNDNRMNEDFILENKHLLKTTDDLYQAWETVVNLWNKAKHPKFNATRNEVYLHEMPQKETLSLFDIMDKMWVQEVKKPIQYKAHGLDMWLSDKKYQFEVLDQNGDIDLEFRRKNVGNKFIVRYDPDFLDGYVQLCQKDQNGNIILVAHAEPKREHQNIPVLMKDGDKEQWAKDYAVRDAEYNRDFEDYQKLMQRAGITPQTEIDDQDLMIKFKGNLPKQQRSKVESEENIFNHI
ncbi:hypothetical protein FPG87_12550 [Flavobacterium psychrophilum]|uniref:Integrase catalytic domain-containing protein n=1 Tax=Flavobacterium psychrophilum TaxID=96345 RepID=A0A7U2NHK8_FLAPS|nr:hypothetical protein [Flavobacterium psychrophilum]MBF2091290.1 hypothetical protein [Flavobacterium psychrophilum]OAE92168.1 hypothetical protein SU65_10460 [Flavobacterium psychrophilum]OJH10072.1 hypothetical protein FPG87_12550 [Flavobacterium psychrophilum]QRE05324.1 hypothetical protein H0H26_06980 [Flavobacterium psychrophilum]SNA66981.1 conserved hypothetical protein [Flavobacterium psychrophilum]